VGAEEAGRHMPAVITLDDLAAMNTADRYGHRYEMSPEGTLWITPPSDSEHATIATRLMFWLALAGWSADLVFQAVGIRLSSPAGDGGRIPDLAVWASPQPRGVWLPVAGLRLVVEIVSPSSATMDQVIKVREYAEAGIPRYWTVDRDANQNVTMYVLEAGKAYEVAAKMPLAWLLQTKPADHHLGD
jgi:Uma2 family endonuclease